MSDSVYGDSEEFAQEFKVCMVCGETNCSVHKENPINGGGEPYKMAGSPMSAGDWLALFGAGLGVTISDQDKEEADAGEEKIIHTGEKNEQEEADMEEAEEDDTFPDNLAIHGGKLLFGKYKDIDKDLKKDPDFTHVLFIKNESIMSTMSGNIRHVDHYRAKKDDEGRIPDRLKEIERRAMDHVPGLKRRLYLALEAQARIARQRGLKRGQLDSGRISRVVTEGASDVFAKKADRNDIKTAVSLVLDDSGSMAEIVGRSLVTNGLARMTPEQFLLSKAGCVVVFAYAMGEVLQQLNITFEIVSYEDNLNDPFALQGPGKGRFSIEYKGFDEPWAQAKSRLINYLPAAGGSLTYEACVFAANRLAKRKEDRKIMFQLTDAQSSNYGISQMYELTTDLWRKAKIQYVGIGILEDTMKTYLKERCEIIENLDKLNDTVIERLAKLVHPV